MYKYICLLPLYDDWESLEILLAKINTQMESVGKKVTIIIVNDFSNLKPPKFKPQSNIDKITILNLKINLGSQKAISIGLSYLSKINEKMIVTILDSDGEDDVNKIPEMMKKAEMYNDKIIVSTRTKRKEHYLFQLFYILHKILTFIFTLKWISFGNFSSFDSSMIKKILSNNRSWLAYSGCIAKNCRIYKIQAERKKRLIGESKLSAIGLIYHSLRVNAVFISRALIISFFYSMILLFFNFQGHDWPIYIFTVIIIYNFLLLIVFKFNKQKDFINSANLINKIS